MFLGDGGSLFLGTIIACYVFFILGPGYQFKSGLETNKFVFSILVILYPLIDLFRVFIIRIYNGVSPFVADNNHIHHKVINKVDKHSLALLLIIGIELLTVYFFINLF
jgi:UDP-N-acetylmuramyl pentapeptide phosphotransferase/UDP-N-acetylglucosamine-1-phosphate transferase